MYVYNNENDMKSGKMSYFIMLMIECYCVMLLLMIKERCNVGKKGYVLYRGGGPWDALCLIPYRCHRESLSPREVPCCPGLHYTSALRPQ